MNQPKRDHLERAVADRRDWAVENLSGLVRHPTTLGREQSGQDCIAEIFDSLGYDVRIEPIDVDRIRDKPGFSPVDWPLDGKPNVVAIHDPGESAGRTLAFNGHIDVVSPEPTAMWTSPPFQPRIVENEEDGETWMYGRGAADMKGGTVCYLWALAALQDLGLEPASRVICQSPVEEECTGNGALAILERGHTADACIIPEPFHETILRRQVGVMWFQVRVLGKTTHVLGAGQGVNAIERSWVIIQALRELEQQLNQPDNIPESYRNVEHPINLNVGVINGGDWASTVAGECVTRFRLGLFPGERCDELKQKIERCVADAAQSDPYLREFPPTLEYIGFQAEGCECDIDGEFGDTLRATHRDWRGDDPEELRATCTTDARFFALNHDIPVTCYGPKSRAIHGVDEKVSIDSMQRVSEVLADFTGRWCGLRKRGS
jgi:acetylornithine deacetylase